MIHFSVLASLFLCSQLLSAQQTNIDSLLQVLQRTAEEQTFREALPYAEEMVKNYPNCASLRLELSEYYLLSELVDGQENGTNQAYQQLNFALSIDSTFGRTAKEFGIEVTELIEFKKKLNLAELENQRNTIDSLLYWAILYDFSPNSEYKPK